MATLKSVILLLVFSAFSIKGLGQVKEFKDDHTNSGFLENKGQVTDDKGNLRPDILFTRQGEGVKVFISRQGLHYQFTKLKNAATPEGGPKGSTLAVAENETQEFTTYRLDVKLLDANPSPTIMREEATGYYENFYLEHCPQGIDNVGSYKKISLKNIYPGIDWVLYSNNSFIKYDFVLQPGADPSLIKLKFEGARELKLKEDGSLFINTPLGQITEGAPISFKGYNEVPSRFVLKDNILTFDVVRSQTDSITIDPAIEWGTYYSSSLSDHGIHSTAGHDGSVYIVGYTYGAPGVSSGGHQNTFGGKRDAFLVKFDSSGVRQWATYYGGAEFDEATSCAADLQGNIYMSGFTYSSNAISYNGHQNIYGGMMSPDGFLVKFNKYGTRVWGTYYGGKSGDQASMCATDKNSNVYLGGSTNSTRDISMNGYQDSLKKRFSSYYSTDGFLVKFDSTGTRLWGTYFGGNDFDNILSCAVDDAGNCFVSGVTRSDSGLAFNGFKDTITKYPNSIYGGNDAFIAKFNPSGALKWATYYGGPGIEPLQQAFNPPKSLATDSKGSVYLTGGTESQTGIAHNGFQNTLLGLNDAFLVKFDSNGVREWATYYGGSSYEYGVSCATDTADNVYLWGETQSSAGIANNGFQSKLQGYADAFIVKFDEQGNRKWASYCGGEGAEYPNTVMADNFGNLFLSGVTQSRTNIAKNGHQNTFSQLGLTNTFLIKLDECPNGSVLEVGTCENYYWAQTGITYSKSGNYYDTLTNIRGCDSLVNLSLQISNRPKSIEKVTACDQFTWPTLSKTYTESAMDTLVIAQSQGCDSLVILELTINKNSMVSQKITSCGGYTSPSGKHNWDSSGVYSDTLINKNGCDSILNIDLSVNSRPYQSLSDTACLAYLSPSKKYNWTSSGTYYDTIPGFAGCDSVIQLNLTIKQVDVSVTQTDSNLIAHAKGAAFRWLDCNDGYSQLNGESKNAFYPMTNGRYAAAITQNGCTDTSACYTITGKESMGNPFGTSMTIFPNPTTGVVHVKFGKELSGVGTLMWNSAGKLVSLQNFETTDMFSLEIPWAKGVYYLKVAIAGGKSVLVKIVKI